MCIRDRFGLFGSHLFDDRVMRERLPLSVYESLREIRDEGKPWNPEVADIVADLSLIHI